MNLKKSHVFTLGLMLTALSSGNTSASQWFKTMVNSKDPTATLEDTRRMQDTASNPAGRRNQEVHALAIADRQAAASHPLAASIQPTNTELFDRAGQQPALPARQVVVEAQVQRIFPGRDVTRLTEEERIAGANLARLAPTLPQTEVPTAAVRTQRLQEYFQSVLHAQSPAGGAHARPTTSVVLATFDERAAGNLAPTPEAIRDREQLRHLGIVANPVQTHPQALTYLRDVMHKPNPSVDEVNAVARLLSPTTAVWTQVLLPTQVQIDNIAYLQRNGIATPIDANVVALTYLRAGAPADLLTANPTKQQILAVTQLQVALGTIAPTLVEVQEIAALQGKGIEAPTAAQRAASAFLILPANAALGMQNPTGNQIKAAALLNAGGAGLAAVALNVQTPVQINDMAYLIQTGIDAPNDAQIAALHYLRAHNKPNPSMQRVNAIAHIQAQGWMAHPMWNAEGSLITKAVEYLQGIAIHAPTLNDIMAIAYLTNNVPGQPGLSLQEPSTDQVLATAYLMDTGAAPGLPPVHPALADHPSIAQVNATAHIRKPAGGVDGGLGNANPLLPLITTVANLQTRAANPIARPTQAHVDEAIAGIRLVGLLGGRAPSAAEAAYAAGHLGDADAVLTPALVGVRLNALLGRAPLPAETAYATAHLAEADAPLVAALVDARLNALLGRAPIAAETAYATAHLADADPALTAGVVNARLTPLLNGRAPSAAEVAYANGHLADADAALLPALDNARLVALIGGGRVPSAAELAYAAAHRGDNDAAITNGLVGPRLQGLLGGRVPSAVELGYAAGHIGDADAALTAGAVNARLTALLGRAPLPGETAYAAGHLADADAPLVAALVDARLNALLGRAPTAEETAYAAGHLADADAALTAGVVIARLTPLLGGRAPSAAETAYAAGHLADADAPLVAALVDARLNALLGRAPFGPETAYAAGHLNAADAPLVDALVDARLNALLGRAPTAAETAYAAGHLADADAALTAGVVNARLTALLGRAPLAPETAYAAGHLADADAPLVAALVDARLNALLGRAPTADETAYAAGHLADADPALRNGLVNARLTPLLGGRAPNAAENAYAVLHLADADAPLVAGLVDARLNAMLGRAPTLEETAYAAGHLAENQADLIQGVAKARLIHLVANGAAGIAVNILTPEQVAYASTHPLDNDNALLTGCETARLTALIAAENAAAAAAHAAAIAALPAGAVAPAAPVARVLTAAETAEAVRVRRNASLVEIQEGIHLWNAGAAGGFRANYDEIGASRYFKDMAADEHSNALAVHAIAVAALPAGAVAPAAPAPVVVNPTQLDLQEAVRLVPLLNAAGTDDTFDYASVHNAAVIKAEPVAHHVPNPYAAPGLNAAEYAEARRLRLLPAGPFVGGVSYRQLAEAVRLKAFVEIQAQADGGATPIQIQSSLKIQRRIGGGALRWFGAALHLAAPAGPMIENPTPRMVDAAVLLRTQQNPGGGALINNPELEQVMAVANAELDAPMQVALATAIQNGIPGVAVAAIPYGIAQVTQAGAGFFDLKFINLSNPVVVPPVAAHMFDHATGFDNVGTTGFRVAAGNLPAATAPGKIFLFTGLAADPVPANVALDYVTVTQAFMAN